MKRKILSLKRIVAVGRKVAKRRVKALNRLAKS